MCPPGQGGRGRGGRQEELKRLDMASSESGWVVLPSGVDWGSLIEVFIFGVGAVFKVWGCCYWVVELWV